MSEALQFEVVPNMAFDRRSPVALLMNPSCCFNTLVIRGGPVNLPFVF